VRITVSSQELSSIVVKLQPVLMDRKMGYVGVRAHLDQSLEGMNGTLQLNASDAHMDLYAQVNCMVQGVGECFIAARLFTEIVKQLPTGEVGLSIEENALVVRVFENTQFQMKLPLIDKFSWLEEPHLNDVTTVKLETQALSYLTSQVITAVGLDSAYIYSEVGYFHHIDGHLRLVATDSVRLSYSQMPCDIGACDIDESFLKEGICIARKGLMVMQKMADHDGETIDFSLSAQQDMCSMSVPGFKVFIRLSYAAYPHYMSVLLNEDTPGLFKVNISRELFLGTMRRILLVSPQIPIVQLSFFESQLTISSQNKESWGKEVMELSTSFPQKIEIGLHGTGIIDVLSHLAGTHVILTVLGRHAPFVIYALEEPYGCHSRHVFAPVDEQYGTS